MAPRAAGVADFAAALSLARQVHAGQVDKAGCPYIDHVERVIAGLEATDTVGRIVAALHDAVEDTPLTLADIAARFGTAVARGVDGMTRRDGESYSDFITRCGSDPVSRRVKLADLADNMRLDRLPEIGPDDLARLDKYRAARARLAAVTG